MFMYLISLQMFEKYLIAGQWMVYLLRPASLPLVTESVNPIQTSSH
jgi:hypothetical protein